MKKRPRALVSKSRPFPDQPPSRPVVLPRAIRAAEVLASLGVCIGGDRKSPQITADILHALVILANNGKGNLTEAHNALLTLLDWGLLREVADGIDRIDLDAMRAAAGPQRGPGASDDPGGS